MKISIYQSAYQAESQEVLDFKDYIEKIKTGFWEDIILQYHTGKIKKELIPAVTTSGTFLNKRSNDSITSHSGIICLDFDAKENPEILSKRDEIYTDSFLFAGNVSVSGKGLALYFKINPKKHTESFLALEKYLANKYHIISDPSCKNVSRLRFVSYDPECYLNEKSEKWIETVEKKQVQPYNYQPIFAKNDVEFILEQVQQTGIDLTADYHNWISLGFAIVNEYGEGGREYFHIISRNYPEYNAQNVDKKYDSLLNVGSTKYHINTLFWLAKNAGLKIKTPQTEKVQRIATIRKNEIGKTGGIKDIATAKESAAKYLNEIEGISNVDEIIEQVMQNNTEDAKDATDIEIVIEYVKSQGLRYNVITQRVEINNTDVTDNKENTIFLNAKIMFPKAKVNKDLILSIVHSENIPQINPIVDFIEKNKHLKPTGNIRKLLECFELKTDSSEYALFCAKLIEKWLISIISSIHGTYSLLILVLIGEQMTNKTNFFRFLLPEDLQRYYGESKLDRDKDDEILMSQKLILVDDEFAGKSKKEAGKLKELSSKQIITARKSYGRNNEDYPRLAVLGGTSNDNDIINDHSGNRRVLPIHINSIDFQSYKSIDKTELFMELYWKWREVGDGWMLTKSEVETLNKLTTEFQEISIEEDMIKKCFKIPENETFAGFMTATDMINYCESRLSKQKLYHKTFGKVLKKLGFQRVNKYKIGYGYLVMKID
jgi:predicted P-loop ATPase